MNVFRYINIFLHIYKGNKHGRDTKFEIIKLRIAKIITIKGSKNNIYIFIIFILTNYERISYFSKIMNNKF